MEARAMTLRTSLPSRLFLALVLTLITGAFVYAQTSMFTYQGRFTDGGSAANGTYDMQFKLFDGTGNQVGSAITNGAVQVSGGVFTVQLDFGAAAFPGADRFLEIGVRSAGSGEAYTVLSPRQQLTSAVYAIRAGSTTTADTATSATTATNATQLGGVAANQYVLTSDPRLIDARTPAAGSANYIQNSINQQIASFNISGDGRAAALSANIVNANTQYSIAGVRIISAGGNSNIFVGPDAGNANTGGSNSFFGANAGLVNTVGSGNAFFGSGAGKSNQIGNGNSFFGLQAGFSSNANSNSFFGNDAGVNNTIGHSNTFVGQNAGRDNVDGISNTIVGRDAGSSFPGSRNTLIGASSGTNVSGLTNATAIGYNARVAQSNSLVLGSIDVGAGTPDTNVGIGTTAPAFRFTVKTTTSTYGIVHTDGTIILGSYVGGLANGGYLGTRSNHSLNFFVNDSGPSLSIDTGGLVHVNTLGAAGATTLCRNAANQISTCSSSLRYKTNIQPFVAGLSVLNRLRPIKFDWKQGGTHDLGFGAEDIAAIEPLLVTRNEQGEVEGVKYDRISAVLVNAVKEQQAEIEEQKTQIAQQRSELLLQRQQIEKLTQIVSKKFGPATGRRKR